MAEQVRVHVAGERPVAPADVKRLYDGAGWWPERDLEDISAANAGSVCVGAWQGERLVGFARAISDGRHRAYVEDVVVDPEARGSGVGIMVVRALCDALADVRIVSLFCEPERVSFYEANGFRPSHMQVMMHREREDVS